MPLSLENFRAAVRLLEQNDSLPSQPIILTEREAATFGVDRSNPSVRIVPNYTPLPRN